MVPEFSVFFYSVISLAYYFYNLVHFAIFKKNEIL